MKSLILIITLCALAACSKNADNNATPSISYSQAIDSFHIQLNKKYLVTNNQNDTVIFKQSTIQELYNGTSTETKVFSKMGQMYMEIYTIRDLSKAIPPVIYETNDTLAFNRSDAAGNIFMSPYGRSGASFKLSPLN